MRAGGPRAPTGHPLIAPAAGDDALHTVWIGANRPGVDKLVAAARRAGMPLSRAGAQSFINRQSVAQIFAPARKSEGAIPARSLDALWQCDLLDMSSLPKEPNDDFQYILVCTNVF